ncbi:MotE family protein [Caulobacter soli]|uniref:MotE family protein n=1 Tax=Caulobacter soli TaxID=2708539 RepID=UPI0013ECF088|nr:MotE family protein [Caulobacter soli]
MKNVPRILPIVGVAVVGVLAVNALAGAKSVPDMLSGAKAFAEGVAKPDAKGGEAATSAADAGKDAAAKAAPPPVCAPSSSELAKEAGLSPAELRVLQSLGQRRGQLDQREQDIDVQLQLLSAAEAKLDAKMKALNGMKGDIQGLLGQADAQKDAEAQRMVLVYSAMKPKDAAARMSVLDDSVRLPIASKMKERTLSMILANMSPNDAKILTERLANRLSADAIAKQRAALAAADKPAADPSTQAAAAPLAGGSPVTGKAGAKKAG